MTTFEHGGDVTAFAEACGCKVNEVTDLSSNINFVKPRIEIDFNALNISAYPSYDRLYHSIAMHYNVDRSQIELYNGGSTAIFSFFRELALPHCTIYSPAYLEYKKAAQLFGYELQIIDRFTHFEAEIKENSLIIFVNPSTPDGMFYEIEKLLILWQEKNCTVLIDESFIEFTSYHSASKYLEAYDNLYILKSMTKFYGAAGIRVGTLLSQASNIEKLRKNEPLWKLSEFDSAYIQAVLKDDGFKVRSDIANEKSKRYLLGILQNAKQIKTIYPSDANYILVELEDMTAKEFQKLLLPYKIMIRPCENFDGLGEQHVRIAVKSIEDLKILAKGI